MEHPCTKRSALLAVLPMLMLFTAHLTAGHPSISHRTLHSSCSRCPPGFGVLHKCTATEDTVCRSCQTGTFSSRHSRTHPCMPCSSCAEAFVEIEPCLPTRNAVCAVSSGDTKETIDTLSNDDKTTSDTELGNPIYEPFTGIDEEIARGMSHLASFQIALVLALVTALLATTLRLGFCTSNVTSLQERTCAKETGATAVTVTAAAQSD